MVLITAGFLKLKQTVMMEGKGVCACVWRDKGWRLGWGEGKEREDR